MVDVEEDIIIKSPRPQPHHRLDLTITMQGSSAPLGLLLSAVAHWNKTRVVRATAGVSQGTVRTQRRAL